MRRTLSTLAVVALVALAGCTGGFVPGDGDGESATMNFYVSDQPGALEDFAHLNVTVTEVELLGGENGTVSRDVDDTTVDLTRLEGSNATLIDTVDVPAGNYTGVFLQVDGINGTLESGGQAEVKLPSEKLILNKNFTLESGGEVDFVYDIMVVKAGASGMYIVRPVASESGTDVDIDEVDARVDDDGDDDEPGDEAENGQQGSLAFYVSDERNDIDDFDHLNVTITKVRFHRGGESGNWTEREVDDRTVDLTELKGDNATLLSVYDLPAGNYTKVSAYVSETNGTLVDGGHPEVKLPSGKLMLTENFAVEENATTDFVFDITVIKRGNSGAYNIKPQASESGTDVPIDDVETEEDERDDDADEPEGEKDDPEDDRGEDVPSLNATFVGNVTAGENATVSVTDNGSAVENATVTVEITANGTTTEATYRTAADGTVEFAVPEDAEELEVEVEYEDASVSLEREFEAEEEAGAADGSSTGGNETAA